jgi:uncharacterized membrane protein
MQSNQTITGSETQIRDLNRRLEEVGWALFLIMIGSLWLLPEGRIPSDVWLIGAGLIMLGVNFARYFMRVKMSGFTVFLGILALVAGLSGVFNLKLPLFAALFIIFGVSLLMRALFKKRNLMSPQA